MKKFKMSIIIAILIILLIYVANITAIPRNIILFQGEQLNLKTILGIKIQQEQANNYQSVQASKNLEENISNKTGKVNLNLKLGDIDLKKIEVNVIPKTIVVPVGNTIGLKLYTSGVLVVGMSEIEGEDKNKYKPYQNSGIEEGDMIIKIQKEAITCTVDLIKAVNTSNRGRYRSSIFKRRESIYY